MALSRKLENVAVNRFGEFKYFIRSFFAADSFTVVRPGAVIFPEVDQFLLESVS